VTFGSDNFWIHPCISAVMFYTVKTKVKLSLCFTKYHDIKTYSGVEV
jgi:hypothetical protein